MKRHLILMMLFVFAACGTMRAQVNDTTNLQQENNRSEAGAIVEKEAINDDSKSETDGFCFLCDSRLRKAKKKVADLEKHENSLTETINALNKEISTKDSQIEELDRKIQKLQDDNNDLENYKKQVEPLVEKQLIEMATSADTKWLGKLYSEIDENEFAEELILYESFKDKDKGVATAYKSLKVFNEDYMLYKQGWTAVNSPYDANSLKTMANSLQSLVKKDAKTVRKEEVETVYEQLKGYKYEVIFIQQEIIGEIDNMLKQFVNDGTDKKAWKQIKDFLEDFEGNHDGRKVEDFITVPWLGEQYQLYLKQLEANPYGPNPAHDAIMVLEP